MNLISAIKTCVVEKYAQFGGRASRSEFWNFTLFYIIGGSILGIALSVLFETDAASLIVIALIIPLISVTVRRLHDVNINGKFAIFWFVPLANIILIYFLLKKGDNSENQYGAKPIQ